MRKATVNKDSVKLVIILCCIALVSSLLLATVNIFTQVDEEAKLKDTIGEIYSSPLTEKTFDLANFNNLEKAEINAVFQAEDGAFIILSKSTNCYSAGNGISLLVIVKDNDLVKISSYSHGETPGLGTNALTESYLKNYENLRVSDFIVNGEVVGSTNTIKDKVANYTGATKSSNGVRDAVTNAVRAYLYIEKGVA